MPQRKKQTNKITPGQVTQAVYDTSYRKINEKIDIWGKSNLSFIMPFS